MALALEHVGYRYAGASRPSLLGIDFVVADGEVVGVAGASDAGKTTLCLVLSGLAPRTIGGQIRGRVLLDGEEIDGWPIHRLSERIGVCFQSPAAQLSQVARTVFEEVAFGPMNLGIDRDEIVERTWSALDELRIADLAARDPLQRRDHLAVPAGDVRDDVPYRPRAEPHLGHVLLVQALDRLVEGLVLARGVVQQFLLRAHVIPPLRP
jgi:ABC-type sulfate/molybdate transport systems ATPase subunit